MWVELNQDLETWRGWSQEQSWPWLSALKVPDSLLPQTPCQYHSILSRQK